MGFYHDKDAINHDYPSVDIHEDYEKVKGYISHLFPENAKYYFIHNSGQIKELFAESREDLDDAIVVPILYKLEFESMVKTFLPNGIA